MASSRILKIAILLFCIEAGESLLKKPHYEGDELGTFETISNEVKGNVFLIDDTKLIIKGFTYDGHNKDAVFWAGYTEFPDTSGFTIPYLTYEDTFMPIPKQCDEDIMLFLQDGTYMESTRWLSVWDTKESKSLGILIFSKPSEPPRPLLIGHLGNTKPGLSTGDILILDTQRLLVPNFFYDGSGKEVVWWLSKVKSPIRDGISIQCNQSNAPVKPSHDGTLILDLPKDHFIDEFRSLSLWDILADEYFGLVDFPENLHVPPSPKTLGYCELEMDEFNCEMLNDNLGLEIRWLIKGDDIIVHLVGNIGSSQYMALGAYNYDGNVKQDSADAVVAGIDNDGRGYAVDYFFQTIEKCENATGMCPDSNFGSPNNLTFLYAVKGENSTFVAFKRRLIAEGDIYDQQIYTDGPQSILWAVGPLQSGGFPDTPTSQNKGNLLLDFGRHPDWNCPAPKKIIPAPRVISNEEKHHIHCPSDRLFRAQIGSASSNNEQKVWFINGLPTPKITIQRGNTYTFIIEGGVKPPIFHPFYITSSEEGGLLRNIIESKDVPEQTYAGIDQDNETGAIFPTAEGRLCDWTYSDTDPNYDIVTASKNVQSTLVLNCEPGEPGELLWTPTEDSPDFLYYQSFTERNIGGKLHVVDFCEETDSRSYLETVTEEEISTPLSTQGSGLEIEREIEGSEFVNYSNIKNEEELSAGEPTEKIIPEKIIPEKMNFHETVAALFSPNSYNSKKNEYSITNNVIPSSKEKEVSGNFVGFDSELNPETKNLTISLFQGYERETTESPFPHDESERSDLFVPHYIDELPIRDKISLTPRRVSDEPSYIQPDRPSSEISSIPALISQPPQEFKPHFEGGFIPLVMNPMKEKDFPDLKEFNNSPQPRSRTYRPFLYNESVPFHGTFKPGVPDFSGFNISHYSQEDASTIIGPNQDNVALLSASKPQPVHKSLPSIGSIPLHLLQRHNGPPQRFQRPQDFGVRFRQQNPSFNGLRQNVFPRLSVNGRPKLPMPNIRDEDLAGIPSQRVYVALQASGEKNPNKNPIPNRHVPPPPPYNRKNQHQQPNKIVYPPPIQRRPDFYDDKEANSNRKHLPQRNFNPQGIISNLNRANVPQKMNLPNLQSGSITRNSNNRPQISGSTVPVKNNLPGKTDQAMFQQGQMRQPYPLMQIPSRDRIPQFPLQSQGSPIRQFPPTDKNLKLNEAYLNFAQNRDRLTSQFPSNNLNRKFPEKLEEMTESQNSEPSSEEQFYLPHLLNAELIEVPNQNERLINSGIPVQNKPLNDSINAFIDRKIIRNPFPDPNVNQLHSNPNNMNIEKVFNYSLFPEGIRNSEAISENDNLSGISTKEGSIPEHDMFDINAPTGNNNRNGMTRQEEKSDTKIGESIISNQPIKFDHHEVALPELSEPQILSAFQNTKVEVPAFTDYEQSSEDYENKDSVNPISFSVYHIPFGARLNLPNNVSIESKRPPQKSSLGPLDILWKYQRAPNSRNKNSQNTQNSQSITSTTTKAPVVLKESVSVSVSSNNQGDVYPKKGESEDTLYYNPPFASPTVFSEFSNNSSPLNQNSMESGDVKHIPIIADTLEGLIEATYLGRKNILPTNSNTSFPVIMMPPNLSENINLPQISDNLPSHDNGTDYSILNHIMALIGSPPEPKSPQKHLPRKLIK